MKKKKIKRNTMRHTKRGVACELGTVYAYNRPSGPWLYWGGSSPRTPGTETKVNIGTATVRSPAHDRRAIHRRLDAILDAALAEGQTPPILKGRK